MREITDLLNFIKNINNRTFFVDIAERVKNAIEASKNNFRDSIKLLAHRGWFNTHNMTFVDVVKMGELFSESKFDEIDSFMINHTRISIKEISKYLKINFPHRYKYLRGSFKHFKDKNYYDALNSFVIQAEGICKEIFNTNLYSIPYTNKSDLSKKIENEYEDDIILESLKNIHALNRRNNNENYHNGIVSRNELLHGESLEYYDEVNCLRAISLIDFLINIKKDKDSGEYKRRLNKTRRHVSP